MTALGRHIIVEYYDCDEQLMNDVTHIETSMEQAAEAAGATIINSTFHHFSLNLQSLPFRIRLLTN